MNGRRWSLERRLTLLFALGTAVLLLTVAVVSDKFLRESNEAELDARTEARLKDLRVRFQALPNLSREERIAVADEIAAGGTHRVAFRFWNVTHGWVDGEAGAKELLTEAYPAHEPTNETRSVPGGLRWRTETFQGGLLVGILLDGSPNVASLRRYELFAGLLLVGGAMGGALIGWLMMHRASDVLRRVAESARKVQEPAEMVDVDVSGAPEEIRDVVDALHELLGNIQVATERHRVLYASMAHELRAPIQNLVGATEVALLSQRDADAYRRVLESNLDELRELGDAIDNLMTICAPRTAAVHTPVSEHFDLLEEARLRLGRERARAGRAGVALEIESSGSAAMRGDRESLLRALRNLAANAIEWSPRGGRVRVEILGAEEQLVITVDDQGPGVPAELREKVFDPFYRGPSAHGRRVGYGLGLAIVKDAAERHAGTVRIEASPAGGARFVLTVPRHGLASAAARVPAPV